MAMRNLRALWLRLFGLLGNRRANDEIDAELESHIAMHVEDGVRAASTVLIGSFALLALLMACIGVYGVMAYSVSRRTREIGVRMALGAKRADVLRMVLGSGLRLALIGIGIGLAGALATSRLLTSLLFEMSPLNPLIFGLAAVVLAATAVTASLLPARRAASVDPMQALRVE
jgi:ABC-type antimicrobial peptide transport system permease subunit